MDEGPDRPDGVVKFFGEGQGCPDQTRDSLPQGVVKAFNMIGQASFFTNLVQGFVVKDRSIGIPKVGVGLSI
jgi:hypothetical protein